jgi:ABC-type uncharacterized transport system involved in gliding motility auxiliary subunit
MQRRNTLLTTNALVSAALIAALLVALNYLGIQHHVRWDLTKTREHSLSPQTVKVLRSLPGPIEAVAFVGPDGAGRYRETLASYQYYSKNFQYRIVDPNRHPAEAQTFKQKYNFTAEGQVVLLRGKGSYTIDSISEEQLTNGILHLLETAKKTVYVLQGEGEVPLDDFTRGGMGTAKQHLAGKGFDVKALFLVQSARVPDDAAAVIVPSPTRDLLPQVRTALERYYEGGGKLLIMVDPQTPPEVRGWLGAVFHVDAPGGAVIDPFVAMQGGDVRILVITQYPYNDITQNFGLATFFPLATPLVPQAKAAGVTITPVIKSTDSSYVKVNLEAKTLGFEPGIDIKGPVILAVEVTPAPGATGAPSSPGTPPGGATAGSPPPAGGPNPPGTAKPAGAKGSAVIFGNSAFVQNTWIKLIGNRDLFTSAVGWLTQTGNLVSIAPRTSPFEPFIVGGVQARWLFLTSVIGVPLLLLVLGGSVYMRRRRL